MQAPRTPTPEEMRALSRISGCSEEDVRDMTYVAVFDDYVTGGPGYFGKLMMVVWDGSPSCYEVFTWNEKGEIQRQTQDK